MTSTLWLPFDKHLWSFFILFNPSLMVGCHVIALTIQWGHKLNFCHIMFWTRCKAFVTFSERWVHLIMMVCRFATCNWCRMLQIVVLGFMMRWPPVLYLLMSSSTKWLVMLLRFQSSNFSLMGLTVQNLTNLRFHAFCSFDASHCILKWQ